MRRTNGVFSSGCQTKDLLLCGSEEGYIVYVVPRILSLAISSICLVNAIVTYYLFVFGFTLFFWASCFQFLVLRYHVANMVDYTTCQSSGNGLVHGDSPDDAVLHYFGCLKFSEREAFLDELEDTNKLKLRIRAETSRIAKLRSILEAEGPTTASGKVLDGLKKTVSHYWPGERRDYSHLQTTPPPQADPNHPGVPEEREKSWILSDLNANAIYFKKKQDLAHPEPYDHPDLRDNFPNQKIPLELLLGTDEKNPLMWPCEPGMIRYFHLPANNMEWIEVKPDPLNTQLSRLTVYCYAGGDREILQRGDTQFGWPLSKAKEWPCRIEDEDALTSSILEGTSTWRPNRLADSYSPHASAMLPDLNQ